VKGVERGREVDGINGGEVGRDERTRDDGGDVY
jgi:hypothetical protein